MRYRGLELDGSVGQVKRKKKKKKEASDNIRQQ